MTKKELLLTLAKHLGAFWIARKLTGRGLRILCYHGISVIDEHDFRGRLFMREETFRARMQTLKRLGYPVLGLQEALQRQEAGTLPQGAVVITFDDGWDPACARALPWLLGQGLPVTLYVSTYYMEKGTQVFNVAVQYLFWKTTATHFDLPQLPEDPTAYDLTDSAQRAQAQNAVLKLGKRLDSAESRQALLEAVADRLAVDLRALGDAGGLRFASRDTLREIQQLGVDLQLHTHRHNLFDGDASSVRQEILDNRAALAHIDGQTKLHFCYPGGIYSRTMWPILDALDIKSATTCETGFNYPDTPRLGLKRILDEETLTPIEFEAELCGLFELRRRVKGLFSGMGSSRADEYPPRG